MKLAGFVAVVALALAGCGSTSSTGGTESSTPSPSESSAVDFAAINKETAAGAKSLCKTDSASWGCTFKNVEGDESTWHIYATGELAWTDSYREEQAQRAAQYLMMSQGCQTDVSFTVGHIGDQVVNVNRDKC